MNLLQDAVNPPNKVSSLHSDILAESVVSLQDVTYMMSRLNPGKTISIQLNFIKINLLSREVNTFSLGFNWIAVGAELQVVVQSKLLTNVNHSTETHSAWTKENYIISINHDTIVG